MDATAAPPKLTSAPTSGMHRPVPVKWFSKLADALDALDASNQETMLVAAEKARASGGGSYYTYACVDPEHVINQNSRPSPHLNEVLAGTRPCRFYLDIDGKGEAKGLNIIKVINGITQRLESLWDGELIQYDLLNNWSDKEELWYQREKRRLMAGEKPETHLGILSFVANATRKLSFPLIFSASRADKASFHVVYQFQVNGPEAAGRIIKALKLEDDKLFDCVDRAVYHRNSLFRMPGASKVLVENSQLNLWMPPMYEDDMQGNTPWMSAWTDPEFFGLLGSTPDMPTFVVPGGREQVAGVGVSAQDRKYVEAAVEMLWKNKLGPLQNEAKRKGGYVPEYTLYPLSWTRDGEVGFTVHPGLPCNGPGKTGPHDNNGSCFKISRSKDGHMYFLTVTCMDPQCPNRVERKEGRGLQSVVQWTAQISVLRRRVDKARVSTENS